MKINPFDLIKNNTFILKRYEYYIIINKNNECHHRINYKYKKMQLKNINYQYEEFILHEFRLFFIIFFVILKKDKYKIFIYNSIQNP